MRPQPEFWPGSDLLFQFFRVSFSNFELVCFFRIFYDSFERCLIIASFYTINGTKYYRVTGAPGYFLNAKKYRRSLVKKLGEIV